MTRFKSSDCKLFVLLTFAFATLNFFGQEAAGFSIRLKFHPSALIAYSRPTILGSVEFKFHKIGIDIAYGQQYLFIFSSNPDTLRIKNFGNQYRVDLKYYFNPFKKDNHIVPFVSVGYCKMYTQQNLTTDWFSGYVFNPSFAYIDNIHVFYFNYGVFTEFKRILLEGALGGGVRIRKEESVYANKIVYNNETRVLPHLSISLRIGYLLINKPKRLVKPLEK